MAATEAADATRELLDLPSEVLEMILERGAFDALQPLGCASRTLREPVAAMLRSKKWRTFSADNMPDACLAKLRVGAYQHDAYKGISGGLRGLAIEGDLLCSASKDQVARLWGLRTAGTCFAEWAHPGWVGACAFSEGGELLATGCDDSVVRVWRTALQEQSQPPVELRGASTGWSAKG